MGRGVISAVCCSITACSVCTGCGTTGRGAGGQGGGGLKDSCHGVYVVVLGYGIKCGAANRGAGQSCLVVSCRRWCSSYARGWGEDLHNVVVLVVPRVIVLLRGWLCLLHRWCHCLRGWLWRRCFPARCNGAGYHVHLGRRSFAWCQVVVIILRQRWRCFLGHWCG